MNANTTSLNITDQTDAELLERQLETLIEGYQQQRSPSLLQSLLRCLEALIQHPQLSGGDEQRCQYCRMARRWRYLGACRA